MNKTLDAGGSDEFWSNKFGATGINTNGKIFAIEKISSDIFLAGRFPDAGGYPVNNIAKWNGVVFSALGSGLTGTSPGASGTVVNALAVYGTDLYAGGSFSSAGGVSTNSIARWNGSAWSALGSTGLGADGTITEMLVNGTYIYIGGSFSMIDGVACNHVARYNILTNRFEALGGGVGGGSDGSGPEAFAFYGDDLYVGGFFSTRENGTTSCNGIAVYNTLTNTWRNLGGTQPGNNGFYCYDPYMGYIAAGVTDIVVYDQYVYITGQFTGTYNYSGTPGIAAKYFIRWDPAAQAWSAMGDGFDYFPNVMINNGDDLYIGGYFLQANGQNIRKLCRWNISSNNVTDLGYVSRSGPSAVDNGGTVNALHISNDTLYAGGVWMSFIGNDYFSDIARLSLSNSDWSGMAVGLSGKCNALLPVGKDNIIAAGMFRYAGEKKAGGIARFDGQKWTSYEANIPSGEVFALAATSDDLYAGGYFFNGGGLTGVNSIMKWNRLSSAWSALGSGISGGDYTVKALCANGADIYAGGNFTTAGAVSGVNNIAKWDGSAWSAMGSGMLGAGGNPYSGEVKALAYCNGYLYAGGSFTSAGGTAANYIARWNGTAWEPIISEGINGVEYIVFSLAASGTDLIVGGAFVSAGNVSANNIARYNTLTNIWTPLGSGLNYNVLSVAASGGNIYAGGDFTTAGSEPAARIAVWDGAAWHKLGSGCDNSVKAVAVTSQGDVWSGGLFTQAGGKVSTYIGLYHSEGVLPVELTSFTASVNNNRVMLNWATATEINNYGFEIQKSQSADRWQKIGFIEGSGNSNSPKSYSFSDPVTSAGSLKYRLKQIDYDGGYEYSSEIEVIINSPAEFTLGQNYPNPFNPATTISYSLPFESVVSLKVYNLLGQEITTLVDKYQQPGMYSVSFDAGELSSGTYIYRIEAGSYRAVKTMMLIK